MKGDFLYANRGQPAAGHDERGVSAGQIHLRHDPAAEYISVAASDSRHSDCSDGGLYAQRAIRQILSLRHGFHNIWRI